MIELLMVSTSYPSDLSDWRGLFIRHLLGAMARRPELSLRMWSPPGEMPANVAYVTPADDRKWLACLMARGGVAHVLRQGGFSAATTPVRLLTKLHRAYRQDPGVSLYHVNWLQNTIVLPADGKPLLVSVLGNDLKLLDAPLMRTLIRRACRGRAVTICPNAAWMLPALREAFDDVAHVEFVPFGIDPTWFEVTRNVATRSTEQWLCVSRLTAAKLGPLLEWGEAEFSTGRRELHLFGPMQEKVNLPAWVHYHGPATTDTLRETWFPSARGLVTLSRHAEGRPQVMLEAMAAGLPIIASRLPAHSDLLRHGETGWICEDRDSFREGLDALSDVEVNLRIGRQAREQVACEIGTWDDCAARYASRYRDLLERQRHA